MRVQILLLAAVVGACAEEHSEAAGDTCQVAASVRDKAVDDARADEPACTQDADCVLLYASIQCREVHLSACGLPVHRAVLARYEAAKVNERVCEAVEGAELGCSLLTSCAGGLSTVCSAGSCATVMR
jgi:hypothetical protein